MSWFLPIPACFAGARAAVCILGGESGVRPVVAGSPLVDRRGTDKIREILVVRACSEDQTRSQAGIFGGPSGHKSNSARHRQPRGTLLRGFVHRLGAGGARV